MPRFRFSLCSLFIISLPVHSTGQDSKLRRGESPAGPGGLWGLAVFPSSPGCDSAWVAPAVKPPASSLTFHKVSFSLRPDILPGSPGGLPALPHPPQKEGRAERLEGCVRNVSLPEKS